MPSVRLKCIVVMEFILHELFIDVGSDFLDVEW